MDALTQDLRQAIRALRTSPAFALAAILTLALAIGANAVVFAVLKAVVINPLPYRDADRVVTLVESDSHTPNPESVSAATLADLRQQSRSFEHLSLWSDGAVRLVTDGQPDMIRGMRVSANFFDALGMPTYLGRSFRSDDERSGRALILTHGTWTERFGADATLVGHSVQGLDGPYTVVGILPPDFHPLHMSNPAELPRIFVVQSDEVRRSTCRASPCRAWRAIGRLKPDVSLIEAQAELTAIMHELVRAFPAEYSADATVTVTSLREQVVGRFGTGLWIIQAGAVLFLLLACANVGTLILARALARQTEMAVRMALGAGRWRLVRGLFTESLLLAAAAGATGVWIAWSAIRFIAHTGDANLPRLAELTPDRSVLFFGIVVSFATVAVFGIAPAVFASRGALERLRVGRGATGRRWDTAAVRGLMAMEVAIAFVLVLAAGLLIKSYMRVLQVDPGYDPDNVLTLSLLPAGVTDSLAYFDRVVAQTRTIPGVVDAGYASTLPLSHPFSTRAYIREHPPASDAEASNLDTYLVSTNYLDVMRIPVERGRGFSTDDTASTQAVAVISESAARSQFRGEDPLGRHVQVVTRDDRQPWAVIIGVAGDVHQYGLDRNADAAVYLPFAQRRLQGYASLVVRSTIPSEQIESAVRQAMAAVDPLQPVFHLQPMRAYIALSVSQKTFVLALMAAFGGLALALAMAGVYGVVTYVVEQRRRELGVRLALGATAGLVQRMMFRQILRDGAIGASAGLALAVAATRILSTLLFQVSPLDPAIIGGVALLLLTMAIVASYRPVARATRVDPMIVLRAE